MMMPLSLRPSCLLVLVVLVVVQILIILVSLFCWSADPAMHWRRSLSRVCPSADAHTTHVRHDGDLQGLVGALPGTHNARIPFQFTIHSSSDIFGLRQPRIVHRNNSGAMPADWIRRHCRRQSARIGLGYDRSRGGGAGTSEESVIDVGGMVCISTHGFLCVMGRWRFNAFIDLFCMPTLWLKYALWAKIGWRI